jgi:hypothetical protein
MRPSLTWWFRLGDNFLGKNIQFSHVYVGVRSIPRE